MAAGDDDRIGEWIDDDQLGMYDREAYYATLPGDELVARDRCRPGRERRANAGRLHDVEVGRFPLVADHLHADFGLLSPDLLPLRLLALRCRRKGAHHAFDVERL